MTPAGFFVLRTPLLPFDEIVRWSAGLRAPTLATGADPDADPDALPRALDADRRMLRARLDELARRPESRDALRVASPGLVAALDHWRRDPESKKGRRVEGALLRYVVRLSTRPTPFGLFAGCSAGRIDDETCLALPSRDRYRRHSRLDMAYLTALAEHLGADDALRQGLVYRPNSSLYPVGDRLWYVQGRTVDRRRRFTQESVHRSDYLEAVLKTAAGGARLDRLARQLVESDPEIDPAAAAEFVAELVDEQILVSDLAPAITGADALESLLAVLEAADGGGAIADRLSDVRDALDHLDGIGLGASAESYRSIDEAVDRLPNVEHDAPCLLQVDLYKPAPLTLGQPVVDQIVPGIDALRKLGRPAPETELDEFRHAFVERYGMDREVPLLEALDVEIGLGLERQRRAGLVGPWLAELRLGAGAAPRPRHDPAEPWGAREDLLRRKLDEALASGADTIELTAAEVDGLDADPQPLPHALSVLFTLAAESTDAVDAGDVDLALHSVVGPSGARLLGRFCQGDSILQQQVEEHLRVEEAADPDALFAEIVHLPEERLGNILNRPVLRAWEIPFLGRSGAAREHQIVPEDLLVSVVGQRVELRSRRLGRRVEPRLTTAHAFHNQTLGLYRFLCLLQAQGVRESCSWSWAPFDRAAFLPRVRFGRLVLSSARWRVEIDEQQRLGRHEGAARYGAVQRWREARRLPRVVVLQDGDHRLCVDLDNPLAVDHWIEMLVRQERVVLLTEMFPPPDRLCVEGPEGRFVHEIVLPLERRRSESSAPTVRPRKPSTGPRRFAPGSEWLYVKLYAAPSSADALLRSIVAPIRRRALDSGAADQWHFLRFGDPDWHLRLRFHGRPERLLAEVVPWIEAAAAPYLDDGRLQRLQLDTYDREVERYGGDAAIPLIERCFSADSEWALAVCEAEIGTAVEDRWRQALAGVHHLFSDFGIAEPRRLRMIEAMRDAQWTRFDGATAESRKALARTLRQERSGIEAWIAERGDLLDRRSAALAPWVAELRRLEGEGRLVRTVEELLPSLTHMQVNRVMRYAANEVELVIYDFLAQVYRSMAARQRHDG